jgi:hypothetical protein
MKMPLALAALALLAACNSTAPASTADSAKSNADSAAVMKDIQSPYNIMYSSKFVMDDPKNAETLLALWKSYESGNLTTSKDLIADTIEFHLADGTMLRASRDSAIVGVQSMRSSFSAVVVQVNAIMAVKSTDKNEHWALIWGSEKDTHKNGKVDSMGLQETWRFNKDGKADFMYQFAEAAAAPAKMKKSSK